MWILDKTLFMYNVFIYTLNFFKENNPIQLVNGCHHARKSVSYRCRFRNLRAIASDVASVYEWQAHYPHKLPCWARMLH